MRSTIAVGYSASSACNDGIVFIARVCVCVCVCVMRRVGEGGCGVGFKESDVFELLFSD